MSTSDNDAIIEHLRAYAAVLDDSVTPIDAQAVINDLAPNNIAKLVTVSKPRTQAPWIAAAASITAAALVVGAIAWDRDKKSPHKVTAIATTTSKASTTTADTAAHKVRFRLLKGSENLVLNPNVQLVIATAQWQLAPLTPFRHYVMGEASKERAATAAGLTTIGSTTLLKPG